MTVKLRTGLVGEVTYVPKYGGNRDEAEAGREYWSVRLVPANKTQMQSLLTRPRGRGRVLRDADEAGEVILRERVTKVEGLVLEGPGGDLTRPVTGEELWNALQSASVELNEICGELVEAVASISVLEKGLLKNLRSRSDSSAQQTDRGTGVATTVKE